MDRNVRVLVVDDSENDTLLLMDELRDNGYDPDFLRVDTPEAMREALLGRTWDIIIADYTMPKFSGPRALQLLQETGLDIPFILVSGTINEEIAVSLMRSGADDFILKHSPKRLSPAVARELEEAENRRQKKAAEEARRESEERFRLIAETATDAMITIDETGVILFVNVAAEETFGYKSAEMIGRSIAMLVPEQQREAVEDAVERYAKTGEKQHPWQGMEVNGLRKDGSLVPLETSYGDYVKDGKHFFTGILRNITERKVAEQRERESEAHMREFYRRTILAATGGKLAISDRSEIVGIDGDVLGTWVINSPEDLGIARAGLRKAASVQGMAERKIIDMLCCASEAMANAYKHAGQGTVSLHRLPEAVLLVVADEGPGIEALSIPDVALTRGYSTAVSLGMGYKLMIEIADKVYLATGQGGTTVAVEVSLAEKPDTEEDQIISKAPPW